MVPGKKETEVGLRILYVLAVQYFTFKKPFLEQLHAVQCMKPFNKWFQALEERNLC
jgi:hypothetical protein